MAHIVPELLTFKLSPVSCLLACLLTPEANFCEQRCEQDVEVDISVLLSVVLHKNVTAAAVQFVFVAGKQTLKKI